MCSFPSCLAGPRTRIRLYRIGAYVRGRGLQVEMHVRRGAAVSEILAAARDDEVDVISMATHCRDGHGPRPFDFGGEAVLRESRLPY